MSIPAPSAGCSSSAGPGIRSHLRATLAVAIRPAPRSILADPRNASAYELRARAKVRSKAFRAAIDDATEAIRLEPSRVEAFSIRGAAYNGIGEWNHAIVDLNESIRRDPRTSWLWFERAS